MQFYLVNDQYPKTIKTSTYVLSNNILEPKFYENNTDKRPFEKAQKDTKEDNNSATRFDQKDATCYCCG